MGEEFERIAFLPIGVGQREEVAASGGAGVVEQDVEPAELALERFDQFLRPVRRAQVEDPDGSSPAHRADFASDLLERLAIASCQHQVAALGGQR